MACVFRFGEERWEGALTNQWTRGQESFDIYFFAHECQTSTVSDTTGAWWFQPIWKICSSNLIISPQGGVKIHTGDSCKFFHLMLPACSRWWPRGEQLVRWGAALHPAHKIKTCLECVSNLDTEDLLISKKSLMIDLIETKEGTKARCSDHKGNHNNNDMRYISQTSSQRPRKIAPKLTKW